MIFVHSFLFPLLTVSVTGVSPLGIEKAETAEAFVVLGRTQEVYVMVTSKLVDSDSASGVSAGDTIEYGIEIVNTGTATISAVGVTSSLLDAQFEGCVLGKVV